MRIVAYIVLAGVLLNVAQSTVAATAIVLGVMVLWGAFFRPDALCGLLAFGLFLSLLDKHPLATLGLLALAVAVDAIKGRAD